MSEIHPTAIVSPKAELADDVTVGPYTIIEDDVIIGTKTQIASSVLIGSGTRLGVGVTVAHGAVVGTKPQDLKFQGEKTTLEVGDGTTIREYATLNRGTVHRGKTTIGKNCLIMAYAHIAHDCIIGDHVILANSVNLAGHIDVQDYVIIGGIVPVLQFVKIGTHAMVGGGFRVQQDICPYALVAGYPLKVMGLNVIGLKRRGFKPEVRKALRRSFKFLFFSRLNTSQAIERIKSEIDLIPEIQAIIDFTKDTKHGMVK